jgi:hypothetical protein
MSSPIAIRGRTTPIPINAMQANDPTTAFRQQTTPKRRSTTDAARKRHTTYEPSVPRGPDFGRWMLKERAIDGLGRDIISTYGRYASGQFSREGFLPLLIRVRQFPRKLTSSFHSCHQHFSFAFFADVAFS